MRNIKSGIVRYMVIMPVRFSAGYVLADSEFDFEEYLKIAEERMYMNKKARKTGRD